MQRKSAREAFEIAAGAAFVALALALRWQWSQATWFLLHDACKPVVPVTSVYCGVDVVVLIGGAIVATIFAVVWFAIGVVRWSAQRKLKT